MEILNRATEDADAFTKMMEKAQRSEVQRVQAVRALEQEVAEWNALVERRRAEKKARKAQLTKALDGLR